MGVGRTVESLSVASDGNMISNTKYNAYFSANNYMKQGGRVLFTVNHTATHVIVLFTVSHAATQITVLFTVRHTTKHVY